MNYYDLLDLKSDCTQDEIKKAYRRLAIHTHPDRSGGNTSSLFRAVQIAYETLIDPDKRKAYNAELNIGQYGHTPSPPPPDPPPPPPPPPPPRPDPPPPPPPPPRPDPPPPRPEPDKSVPTLGRAWKLFVGTIRGFMAGCVVGGVLALLSGIILTMLWGGEIGGVVSFSLAMISIAACTIIGGLFGWEDGSKK